MRAARPERAKRRLRPEPPAQDEESRDTDTHVEAPPPEPEPPRRIVVVPTTLRKPHPVVAEMRDGTKHLPITKQLQPRALRIVQALALAAEREGWTAASTKKSRDYWGREWDSKDLFVINTGEVSVGFRFIQENDRVEHTPTAYEIREHERWSYNRIPEWDYHPSDRLRLELSGANHGRRYRWADRKRWSLEEKLGQIIDEVEVRHREAQEERIEKEAREAERKRLLEEAVEIAKVQLREHHRAEVLIREAAAWRQANELREYVAAMEFHIETLPSDEANSARQWLDWARTGVSVVDPLAGEIRLPEDPEPTPEALNPFLPGWAQQSLRGW
jgi:hypothetical protein